MYPMLLMALFSYLFPVIEAMIVVITCSTARMVPLFTM